MEDLEKLLLIFWKVKTLKKPPLPKPSVYNLIFLLINKGILFDKYSIKDFTYLITFQDYEEFLPKEPYDEINYTYNHILNKDLDSLVNEGKLLRSKELRFEIPQSKLDSPEFIKEIIDLELEFDSENKEKGFDSKSLYALVDEVLADHKSLSSDAYKLLPQDKKTKIL